MLASDRTVDCGCDMRLTRLLPQPVTRGWVVSGCVGCGRVCVTDPVIDEPRPHMVYTIGHEIVAIEADALAWLGRWPRLAKPAGGASWVLLEASLRCRDPDALAQIEQEASATQASSTIRQRLIAAGAPLDGRPSLPPALRCFEEMAQGLEAWPIGGRDAIALIGRASGAGEILLGELQDDPGFRAALVAGLDDPEIVAASYSVIQRLRLNTPAIVEALAGQIERAQTAREAQAPFRLAKWIGARSAEFDAAIRAASARFGDQDHGLRKEFAEVIRLMR